MHPDTKKRLEEKYRKQVPANALVKVIKLKCKKTGLPFDLDQHLDFYNDVIVNQGCQMTGIPFVLDSGWCWGSPSFDRIEAGGGYTHDNVRVILWGLNAAFGTWGPEILLAMVDAMKARSNF